MFRYFGMNQSMDEWLILSIRQGIVSQLKFIDFELKSELLSERDLIRISVNYFYIASFTLKHVR